MNRMSIPKRFAITLRGFGLLKKYCPGLVQGKALYEFISALLPFVSAWFSARIIDELSTHQRIKNITIYAASIVLIHFICTILKNLISRICNEKETQMWNWFHKIFSDKQMSLDFDDLEDAKIQHQEQAVKENLYMFGNGLAQLVWGTTGLVRASVNILAALAMIGPLFLSKSENAMIDHPAWIIVVLLSIALGGLSNSKATIKQNSIFMKWCEDTVWFNRTFMFFGRELCMSSEKAKDVRIYGQNTIAEKVLNKLIQADKEKQADIFGMSVFPAIAGVIIGAANAVCYLFVAIKAFFGAFGVGSIVQYAAALQGLGSGLQEMMFVLSDNAVYCLHLQRLFDYLDIPNHMYQGSLTVEKRDDNEYFVEFRDVSFQYPNTDTYALRHVNFKFKVGRKLAVVGMNGSGKTTFIKLMCRLYDPTEGEILLNGVDIRKYDHSEYMSLFSVVFQDFKLFSFSLGQNVAASANFDSEQVKFCLQQAGFSERLQEMPEGADTCLYKDLEETGVEISGGEAQKIALARALYKDSPFIILDEPTAALDPIAEYAVYSKFNEIIGDKTAIYISHRLSSCRFCDEIIVFDGGEIIQRGSHEKLVADAAGKYHALWYAQAQYYTP